MKKLLALAGMALVLSLGANKVAAQGGPGGGGGFDLAQMQKMILDNLREQFDVKDDAEWKVIGDQLQKVMDARMQVGFGGGAGMARMLRRPNSNGSQDGGNGQGGGRRGGMFGGASNPEADELQKAIDSKATTAELKAAMAKFVEARKQKQAALEKAQADLRKLLSVRQEAIAFSSGLL